MHSHPASSHASLVQALFDPVGLVILLGIGVAAFVTGLIVAGMRNDRGNAWGCAMEAGCLSLLGGMLARGIIALVVALLGNTPYAVHTASWAFVVWAGPVDLIGHVVTGTWLVTLPILLLCGGITGALTGGINGFYRIHDFTGLGWLAFPLDVTWGLSGNLQGVVLHVLNLALSESHPIDRGTEAHRYIGGFGLKAGFRFTQGCVMSNMQAEDVPGAPLFRHERTHVWQNRVFGPFFPLSYAAWMLVLLIPAMIAGAPTGDFSNAVQVWCYFNNPWEVWAYSATSDDRHWGDRCNALLWSPMIVSLAAIPFFAMFGLVCFLVVRA